jgi:transcriptional regulator with XRE-family HTH domain
MIFAEQLKYIMETDGLTKADVVKKTGVSYPTIGRYLSGERSPRVKDAAHIFKSLGYSLDLTKTVTSGKSKNKDLKKNGSGYYDPTAYKAIRKADIERERFMKLLDTIFTICEYAGFHVEGRITLKDKKTGKVWR